MSFNPNQFVTRHLRGEGWTNRAVTQLSYKWTIQHFSLYENDVIKSPKFPPDSKEIQWWVRLHRIRNTVDGIFRYYVILYSSLKLNSASLPAPSTVKFKCYVINSEGKKEYGASSIPGTAGIGTQAAIICISNYLCTKENLFGQKNELLPNDALTLQFKIQVLGLESSINTGFSNFDIDGPELSEDFKTLFSSEECSDFTIIVGDKKFKVHKPVLAARSIVFSAMFKHGMKESKNNEVVITDIKSEIFEKMLFFIYTNEIPKDYDQIGICMDLLIAADKYALNKLKKLCEKAVYGKITIENAAEMLQFADLHQAKQLLEHVQDFFCRNSKEIMDTPEFMLLLDSHPRLVYPLMRKMSSLVSSNLCSDYPAAKRQKKA